MDDLSDLRNGLGLPLDLYVDHKKEEVFTPEQLYDKIQHYFNQDKDSIFLKSWHCESRVVFERFIDGKEFSCIVIENTENNPVALPPTEIIKKTRIYDYRSKYLSGISRKITPIDLPSKKIEEIRTSCMNLYKKLNFKVYARIDGILANDGTIYLNDPNTTSGMLPSSFFFHQAAEIGLNPSDFLTYILHTSLKKHIQNGSCERTSLRLKNQLENSLKLSRKSYNKKLKVALFFGGSSYERHISVESARNIYEKLAASDKYLPVPIFVKGIEKGYELYKISINLLLKDNADDISHRINSLEHPIIQNIRIACQNLTTYYSTQRLSHAQKINYNQLKEEVDFVFIAMHGRPGEDGQIQTELEKINLPYNGSSAKAAQVMINKYLTNEILKENGILIAKHTLISRVEWLHESELFLKKIEIEYGYPLIVKPLDDGCSAAVKKIDNIEALRAFADLIFRKEAILQKKVTERLNIKLSEEFPMKNMFMIEEYISPCDQTTHFLEITGGLLTHHQGKDIVYEVFKPSETVAQKTVLSLEEKFLAGEGQNITPAIYSTDHEENIRIENEVRHVFQKIAKILNVEGYARIDAFVKIKKNGDVDIFIVEINTLPGMTPATCIFHQAALAGYKPFEFVDKIICYGRGLK